MLSCSVLVDWITRYPDSVFLSNICYRSRSIRLKKYGALSRISCFASAPTNHKSRVHYDSLRVLEWDKLCDLVASFAGTSLGREATKAQLLSLNQSYGESLRLLEETNAAVEMHKHGACRLDFTIVDLLLVKSAIKHARRVIPINACEAFAVASMLKYADVLQLNLKAAIKGDAVCCERFMPLSRVIMELVINRSLVRILHQVIDEDGSVKDSASSALKQSRYQVRVLEERLHQLLYNIIRNEMKEASFLEVSNVSGRWCIKTGTDRLTSFKGLLLSSDTGIGRIIEPLPAVPLNDELQHARASVVKAEADVLLMLTEMMQEDLDDIENILNKVIQLDVINARAKYSLLFGGACPNLYLPEDIVGSFPTELGKKTLRASFPFKREWMLYMPKAYHPLLLQQHRQNLLKAQQEESNATDEVKRKLQGDIDALKGETNVDLASLEMQVFAMEQAHPVPVDFFIAQKTRVLVITGPNTGGKTICLKTVGLAAMMAKSGLYVLSSESIQIPWFDSIFADIGDEQSLSQSLSTFSGHLRQISDIQSHSTNQSLVLLDEVGAGTNPLEGAALGISLLESFACSGALLTIATTHHGELKSLKYSNDAFENASLEFDEVNLKPTYKVLWGVPGRSNAINISEQLGLPSIIVNNARELYGVASAEINQVIIDMGKFNQDFQELLSEARHHLLLSRNLHEKLKLARKRIMEHGTGERYKKVREVSEAAAIACSILNKKVRQFYAYAPQPSQPTTTDKEQLLANGNHCIKAESIGRPAAMGSSAVETRKLQSPSGGTKLPKVGDTVQVLSLGRKARVLKVDPDNEEIVVQAGNMKLKLKLFDIQK